MSLVEFFMAAPPVSRTMTALTLAISLSAHLGLVSPQQLIFYLPYVFKVPFPELWRLGTSFFFTSGLGIVLDTYFLWTYSSGLERDSVRFSQPGDFFTYIVFLAAIILVTAGGFLQAMVFISALTTALAYTYSQDNRGKRVTFYIITFNVIWLPWALIGMTFLTGGPFAALIQGTGILAAHAYDFLTRLYPTFGGGRNIIQTPTFVKKMFGGASGSGTGRPAIVVKSYGTSYAAQQQPKTQSTGRSGGGGTSAPSTGSSASASTSSSFAFRKTWGQGRRLGGD